MWNNDWDGSALVIDDYLIEGGENSQFHIVKLNRGYDANGLVQVDPAARLQHAGVGPAAARRHRRPAACRSRTPSPSTTASPTSPTAAAWCRAGTSAASTTAWRRPRCSGSGPATTPTPRSSSTRRASSTSPPSTSGATPAAQEVGQLLKLDPRNPANPIVWSVANRDYRARRVLGHAGAPRRRGHRARRRRVRAGLRHGDRRASCGSSACPGRRGSRRWSSTTC